MITVTFGNDIENIVATDHLYQWDIGRVLNIKGLNVGTPKVHFAVKGDDKALVVQSELVDGDITAKVPNKILERGKNIIAYIYVEDSTGRATIKTVTIPVIPRTKPNDYIEVYDENADAYSELIDIRVGADGKTYSSAGKAVRGQFNNLVITTEKIADRAVTSKKIATETITGGSGGNIATKTVTSYNLADEAVPTRVLGNGAVTTEKLDFGAVTTGELAGGAVVTSKIADGAVTMPKIAEEVFDEFNARYTSIEVIDNIARVEYLNSCTDGSKIYLINSITPPFSTELNVSTGSTYGYLHWVGEMQKLTVIDGVSNAVKTFTRRCQRGEGSQASIIVGWSNFAEQINSYGVVNLGVVDDLSTLNGCTDTQKTYFFIVGEHLPGQMKSYNVTDGYAILNYYKPDNEELSKQIMKIFLDGLEFTLYRTYNPEIGWYDFCMMDTYQCYTLRNEMSHYNRIFEANIAQNTADITKLKTDTLDNTEAITQNTADIDELKVKTLPSINLTLPLTLKTIPSLAFCANQSLVRITIPDNITSIDVGAFRLCKNLEIATIGSGVTSIGYEAFWGCTSLANVTIPNSVTSIGTSAFAVCRSLANVTIPNSVTSIGGSAFASCTSLASITIPNSITSIGVGAFSSCRSLANVTLGNGFNANGLDLSASTKYTAETIVSWLNALADRTGQTQYTLTIGATNKAKLTAEQLAIATNKNWNIA